MKKKSFFNGYNAKLALAVVALTGSLLTGCYKDEGLDIIDPDQSVTLPAAQYTITGTIYSAEGTILTNATVASDKGTVTQNSGSFTISGLSHGAVKVTATCTGFEKQETTVNIAELKPGQAAVYPVNFVLGKTATTKEVELRYDLKVTVLDEDMNVINDADVTVYGAGEYICDVTEHGQEVVLLKGGRGGLGNWHFKTATRQAPRFAQPGEPMQEMTVIMELKLLADVGLVGFPNAGKSTLLASVSAAKPKIANYPFTTLEPNLGIVSYRDSKSFVMADIPGIIEGASAGKGLGLRFLRHIERNSLLLFMVPADSDDIRKEYEILLNELSTFNPEMLDKQRVLAITKSDMLDQELMDEIEPTLPANVPHVFISSITGMGLSVLKDILWEELNKDSNKIEAIVHRPKDVSKLQQELKDMGEDEDLSYEYVEDDEDVEDLEDFEYEEEDWEDDKQ